jgi:hypothetical protein
MKFVSKKQLKKENRHAVTSPELCEKMASNYNWKLERVENTKCKILCYECVFEGHQTSFDKTK